MVKARSRNRVAKRICVVVTPRNVVCGEMEWMEEEEDIFFMEHGIRVVAHYNYTHMRWKTLELVFSVDALGCVVFG